MCRRIKAKLEPGQKSWWFKKTVKLSDTSAVKDGEAVTSRPKERSVTRWSLSEISAAGFGIQLGDITINWTTTPSNLWKIIMILYDFEENTWKYQHARLRSLAEQRRAQAAALGVSVEISCDRMINWECTEDGPLEEEAGAEKDRATMFYHVCSKRRETNASCIDFLFHLFGDNSLYCVVERFVGLLVCHQGPKRGQSPQEGDILRYYFF